MLDIFNNNAFGVVRLTDTINKVPFVPGRAGMVVDWAEGGVTELTIGIEEIAGKLSLINPTARGGPGETRRRRNRTIRDLRLPHYEINDAIYADEVQGVRAFGSETQVENVQSVVNTRFEEHTSWSFDPTLEYQRIGALSGEIKNGDGTVLYNLYDEFGVTVPTAINFDFANSVDGVLREKCTQVRRAMSKVLGNVALRGVHAFCGDGFWDAFWKNAEVRETFLGHPGAAALRDETGFGDMFPFGGIMFENYRGEVDGQPFIPDGECRLFPVGIRGLYRTVNGPADYIETVNTRGLPRYAKQYPMQNGKGVHLDVTSDSLSYCLRPDVLIRGTAA